jgi:hypothetical protein
LKDTGHQVVFQRVIRHCLSKRKDPSQRYT